VTRDPSAWSIEYQGWIEKQPDCTCGVFEVTQQGEQPQRVEVLTTTQIERMLAREMGKEALSEEERSRLLATAGRHLISECIEQEGRVRPLLYLTGQIFRSRGAERRLLEECGLL
jgi:hypothetical protein